MKESKKMFVKVCAKTRQWGPDLSGKVEFGGKRYFPLKAEYQATPGISKEEVEKRLQITFCEWALQVGWIMTPVAVEKVIADLMEVPGYYYVPAGGATGDPEKDSNVTFSFSWGENWYSIVAHGDEESNSYFEECEVFEVSPEKGKTVMAEACIHPFSVNIDLRIVCGKKSDLWKGVQEEALSGGFLSQFSSKESIAKLIGTGAFIHANEYSEHERGEAYMDTRYFGAMHTEGNRCHALLTAIAELPKADK